MNAITKTTAHVSTLSMRLTSGALAVMMGLGIAAVMSQSLHIERLGSGAPVVYLAPVTVMAQKAAAPTPTFAAASTQTSAN